MYDKASKNILLTFDYELFLGTRSGTISNCLLRPTDLILEILQKNKAKAVFFIDTIYLYRLKEESEKYSRLSLDYKRISEQVTRMDSEGHYVFHHIHPHWLNAQYLPEIDQWDQIDYSHFVVSTLSTEKQKEVFQISGMMLNELLPNNNFSGFRAGGLYIQPFEQFNLLFKQCNIKYDFSVLPGFKSDMKQYGFDFSTALYRKPYLFESDCCQKTGSGSFKEFPISSISLYGSQKILNGLWYRLANKFGYMKRMGDGLGSPNKIYSSQPATNMISYETVSIELLSPVKLNLYLKFLASHSYIHFISHPKLISKYHLRLFDQLLQNINKSYEPEFDFLHFQ